MCWYDVWVPKDVSSMTCLEYNEAVARTGRGYTIDVYCANCGTQLYHYFKAGPGHLVKCYVDRILKDFTAGALTCPSCGQQFAREVMMHGRPAMKIVQGKVTVRR